MSAEPDPAILAYVEALTIRGIKLAENNSKVLTLYTGSIGSSNSGTLRGDVEFTDGEWSMVKLL